MSPSAVRRLAAVLAVVAVPALSQAPLLASTATANLSVSATVVTTCSISANAIAFGTYDPITTHAASNLDASGSVVITCTKGATTTIGLDTGSNASGSTRRLSSAGGFLTYELYQDTGRTTVWGNSGGALLSVAAAPSSAARTISVYARLAAGQDVPGGTYTDTVVATVNF